MVTRFVSIVAGLFLGLLGLSFVGALHPLGDSLAVFRAPLAGAAAVMVLLARPSLRAGVLLLLPCFAAFLTVIAPKFQTVSDGPVVVLQRNLFVGNRQPERAAEEALVLRPDVITLQELSVNNETILELLRSDYPFQTVCRFPFASGAAVLSRHPIVPGTELCTDERGLAAVQVDLDGTRVWVVSVHLIWPYPFGQPPQVEVILPWVAAMSGPVIVAGDFNMVPWSHTLRRFEFAARGKLAGPPQPTFVKRRIGLPIDHVIAPGGGRITVLPVQRSDHNGLLAQVFVDAVGD